MVAWGVVGQNSLLHFEGGAHRTQTHPKRCGQRGRPADQSDLGPALVGNAGPWQNPSSRLSDW